jgi:predicted Fe-Mo cluster-binding NifX family protein
MVLYGIATENGEVAAHFGRCSTYTIVEIKESCVISQKDASNPGHSVGSIPTFLNEQGVNVVIAGGMGHRAVQFFNDFGIEIIMGVSGSINSCIDNIKNGTLAGGESTCRPQTGRGVGILKQDEGLHDHNH